MKHRIFAFYILCSLTLSSCSTSQNHGYSMQGNNYEIQLGSTKEAVRSLIGSPTLISNLGIESWYYINQELTSKAFLTPNISSQEILKVTFKNDSVEKVAQLNEQDMNIFSFDKSYTPSIGDDDNLFREFMSNLGKYNVTPEMRR